MRKFLGRDKFDYMQILGIDEESGISVFTEDERELCVFPWDTMKKVCGEGKRLNIKFWKKSSPYFYFWTSQENLQDIVKEIKHCYQLYSACQGDRGLNNNRRSRPRAISDHREASTGQKPSDCREAAEITGQDEPEGEAEGDARVRKVSVCERSKSEDILMERVSSKFRRKPPEEWHDISLHCDFQDRLRAIEESVLGIEHDVTHSKSVLNEIHGKLQALIASNEKLFSTVNTLTRPDIVIKEYTIHDMGSRNASAEPAYNEATKRPDPRAHQVVAQAQEPAFEPPLSPVESTSHMNQAEVRHTADLASPLAGPALFYSAQPPPRLFSQRQREDAWATHPVHIQRPLLRRPAAPPPPPILSSPPPVPSPRGDLLSPVLFSGDGSLVPSEEQSQLEQDGFGEGVTEQYIDGGAQEASTECHTMAECFDDAYPSVIV